MVTVMEITIMKIIRQAIAVLALLSLAGAVAAQETVEYIHTDALGSPVAVSDAGGTVIERTVYEPYGASVGGELTDGPGYAGHVSDSETGLTYMQQRYYDSGIGVFLSVDPVNPLGNGSAQFNRYRYANGNPIGNLDPDGRQCTGTHVTAVCEAGGVAGLVTSTAGAGAARQANIALKQADAFKPFDSRSEMYGVWAKNVEPVSESWGFEIASLIYKAGGGRLRLGPAHSDGQPTSVTGVFKTTGRGMKESGFIHTHPRRAIMSSADMLVSRSTGSMFSGGPNSYYGDLSTAVNRGIDAAMVRNGRIYEFSFESYQRAMSNTSEGPYVRLGDLVREIK